MFGRLNSTPKLQFIYIFIAIGIPLTISLVLILSINLTFWYDNARDLLAAWDNLTKFTLIGPPSGIPGIFYGPYWIWLLSFGLLFSKSPLIVTIITAIIPYFVLFPLLWFSLNKFFDRTSLIIGWLLFIFSSGMTYATQLWNLYPAPLLTLIAIYLFLIADFTQITKKQTFLALGLGFVMGLLVNFHISFGLSFITGAIIFLVADTIVTSKQQTKKSKQKIIINKIYSVVLILFGLLISFLPTMLFELRHGFHQTQTLLQTLFKYGAVITVSGLNKQQILQTFLTTFGNLLHVPFLIASMVLLLLIGSYIYLVNKRKIIVAKSDIRLLLLLACLFAGNLFIYLTAKNPVWEYHFVGVDILFLLLLTFFVSKFSIFRKILIAYAVMVVIISVASFIINFHKQDSHFEQQEDVVKIIKNNAGNQDYTVFAYNASIYSYDFSYLFRWMAYKDVPYDPGFIKQSGNSIYLIVPSKVDDRIKGFIQFRSEQDKFKEVKTWKTQTDFIILKYTKK